ncbi:hypothetical protein VNO80_02062 [Phaseolus coccineus]|uniref:Uncharacterized protein n=1 Tax=Phaseolus coccineus TaxID=3886 RepID=A0AAN9NTK2_PHACN
MQYLSMYCTYHSIISVLKHGYISNYLKMGYTCGEFPNLFSWFMEHNFGENIFYFSKLTKMKSMGFQVVKKKCEKDLGLS